MFVNLLMTFEERETGKEESFRTCIEVEVDFPRWIIKEMENFCNNIVSDY
jgi:hypothetical protein